MDRSDDHVQYPVEVLNRAADIFRTASHVLDQRLLPLLRLSHLVVSVVDDDSSMIQLIVRSSLAEGFNFFSSAETRFRNSFMTL